MSVPCFPEDHIFLINGHGENDGTRFELGPNQYGGGRDAAHSDSNRGSAED